MASKLYEAVASLEEKQLKRLKDFYNVSGSGQLKSDQEIGVALVEYIQDGGREEADFWSSVLDENQLGNKKRIANRLLKTLEQFILLYSLEEDPVLSHLLIAQFYNDRGLQKHVNHSIKKAEQENDNNKGRFLNFYLYKFWLNELKISIRKHMNKPIRVVDELIPHLKKFFDIQKVRLLGAEIHETHMMGKPDEDPAQRRKELEQDALATLQNVNSREVELYKYRLLMALRKGEEEAYQNAKKLINDQSLKLNHVEREESIEVLMNYCTAQTNGGKRTYAKDYILFLEMLDEMDCLLDNGYLGRSFLVNAIVNGIISGQFEWAKQFLETKSRYLKDSNHVSEQPYKAFLQGTIALYEGELDKCLEFLNQFMSADIYTRDVKIKVGADRSLLKVLFLKREFEVVRSKMRTVEKYIKSQKALSNTWKDHNLVIINIIKHLFKHEKEEARKLPISPLDAIWLEKALKVKVF